MKKTFSLFFAILLLCIKVQAQTHYVSASCNGFSLDGNGYYPVAINYSLRWNDSCGTYYVEPDGNYADQKLWGNTDPCFSADHQLGGFLFSFNYNKYYSAEKLDSDFYNMYKFGFNIVRILGLEPVIDTNKKMYLPYGKGMIWGTGSNQNLISDTTAPSYSSYQQYFSIIKALLVQMGKYHLKAIMFVGPRNLNTQGSFISFNNLYLSYLDSVGKYLGGDTNIMAYDFWNEPSFSNNQNSKNTYANYVAEWYYHIKKYAPYQLTTLGYLSQTATPTITTWDPQTTPLDFFSFHYYGDTNNVAISDSEIYSDLYWAHKTIKRPYIVEETGYPATSLTTTQLSDSLGLTSNLGQIGTLYQQEDYAIHTMDRAIDCSCQGYTWWQYQDIQWGNNIGDIYGLVTSFEATNTLHYGQSYKSAVSAFENFPSYTVNTANCTAPLDYYNIYNYTTTEINGIVKDKNGNPIANAVIAATKYVKNGSNIAYPYWVTYTNSSGNYTLYIKSGYQNESSPDVIYYQNLSCSYPGYSDSNIAYPSTGTHNFTLRPTNNNGWTKTDDGSDITPSWAFGGSNQKIYKGNFLGTGVDEILCVQNTGHNSDSMVLFSYDINKGAWERIWGVTNAGNSGIFPYRGNLIVGDFDGNGTDELLGVSSGWMTLFKFQSSYINTSNINAWYWMWSDGGSDSNAMKPYEADLIPGYFTGHAYTEVLGNKASGGGWMTLFKFNTAVYTTHSANAWLWEWSDHGNDSNAMRPYTNLLPGNYDGSGQTQLLGYASPPTSGWVTLFKFDNTLYNHPNAWSWVWSDYGSTSNCDMRAYTMFVPGDYLGANSDQIMAFDAGGGWGTLFDWGWNGSSWNFNWYWSTSTSEILSDWSTAISNSAYIPVRIDKDVPKELFAMNNSSVDMYLMDNYNFCSSIGVPSQHKPLAVNDITPIINSPEVVLFPNPANTEINVVIKNAEEQINYSIYIYNTMGQLVFSRGLYNSLSTIPTGELVPAVYFYRVVDNKQQLIQTGKVIIQR